MTDTEYLEEMLDLTVKLTDACNNFGLRSPEYNAVLKDVAASAVRFNRRRRRWWEILILLWILLAFLAWLCYKFFSFPKF